MDRKLKLTRKKIFLITLCPVLIMSLWVNNIYILFMFSILCWVLLPYKKWWDGISIPLLFFSVFYAGVIVLKGEIASYFLLASYSLAPTAFYRLGCFFMKCFHSDKQMQNLLFFIVGVYLLPLFLLTFQDIVLTGLINDSRQMLMDMGEDNTLAATLYGLMASAGIGFLGTIFAKKQNNWLKIGYIIVAALSLLSVIHLVNRTGLVICVVCLFVAFAVSTKMNVSKMLPFIIVFLAVAVFLSQSSIMGGGMTDAYAGREDNVDADAANAGGRTELWLNALGNMIVSPLGWKLESYAHNLWLDIARVGGWLAFIPFVKASFIYLLKLKKLLKISVNNSTALLLLCVNVAMLLNAAVEPVIDGSLLFFCLLMLIWGMTVNVVQTYTYKNNNLQDK